MDPVVPRPSASIFSMSAAVSRVPLRTTTSLRAILTTIGLTAASTLSFSRSVSSWLNDELGTTRSRISSAASNRSEASSPPAMSPVRRVLVAATSVSRSSVRSTASRTRADSARTADQPSPSRPARVAVAASDRSGRAVWSSAARSSSVISVAKIVSTLDTCRSNASACSAAIAIAFSLVKSYTGSTSSRAFWRAAAVWTSLSNSTAIGATMSDATMSPALRVRVSFGRKSAPRIAVRIRTRIPDAMIRRVASLRVKREIATAREVSMGSVGPAVVGGEVGPGEGLDDEFAHVLAVGATLGLRRQPAHDLAHVARG